MAIPAFPGLRRGAPVAANAGPRIGDAASGPVERVLRDLGTGADGLSVQEAAARLRAHGPNVLRVHRVTAPAVLVAQLRNPLLILLLAAAALGGLTGDATDTAIIGVIVVISVGLGFVNEYRAANAVAALRSSIRHTAVVRRDGVRVQLPTAELVPGDVVALRVGDIVPADLRLIEVTGLECDEAVLTGESLPVAKATDPVPPGCVTADLTSCAFMGTVVHSGGGTGVVVATGMATEFGGISAGLGERQVETAFQAGLRRFSTMLAGVAGVLTAGIFVVNIALSRPILDALLFSLAIAIGITPQLLPAVVSVSLAAGARALGRRRVLVKRLVSIEDLGNIGILFTDKTGTITEGAVTFGASVDARGRPADRPLLLGLMCNEASLTAEGAVGGTPLDAALLSAPGAAQALQVGGDAAHTRLAAVPFDHERRLASVLVRTGTGAQLLITKGAPEAVLERCTAVPSGAEAVLEGLFDQGARVVAIASRDAGEVRGISAEDERQLELEGFLTFVDRPKADAGPAIAALSELGVAVKIITGDNATVAVRVCRELGLTVDGVLTGAEVAAMDDTALAAAIPTTTIFGRVGPDQKARLVKVAHRSGADVAFLGDGVNDAVALHAADVGVSVDSATDVAKDAADIVLLDKDLGVLAEGIREGRRIFGNTLKYVLMATSSNFGNMFSAAGASLFLSYLPMLPSQILLNNLLYDVGQLAIPTDRVDAEAVARPVAWDIGFVRRFMMVFGPLSSVFDFMTFFVMLQVLDAGRTEFRSGWFVESLATQTLVIFVIRTRRVPFLRSRPSRPMGVLPITCAAVGAVIPLTPLAGTLGFTALPVRFFLILLAMIVAYLVLVEAAKARFYAARARREPPGRSPEARHQHRVRRRLARFSVHQPAARLPLGGGRHR